MAAKRMGAVNVSIAETFHRHYQVQRTCAMPITRASPCTLPPGAGYAHSPPYDDACCQWIRSQVRSSPSVAVWLGHLRCLCSGIKVQQDSAPVAEALPGVADGDDPEGASGEDGEDQGSGGEDEQDEEGERGTAFKAKRAKP
jgi:hypothetical protein